MIRFEYRLILAAAAGLLFCRGAVAQPTHDLPAALIALPYLVNDAGNGLSTLVQLSNTSTESTAVSCVYQDLTPTCDGGAEGQSCTSEPVTCTGVCRPRLVPIPFRIVLTPLQPLAWNLSDGLQLLPLPQGTTRNEGRIPALGTTTTLAALRCAVTDNDGKPTDRNALIASATLRHNRFGEAARSDAGQYKAAGFRAVAGANDGDDMLVLGGSDPEYDACPAFLSFSHFFDGALLQTEQHNSTTATRLILQPCTSGRGSTVVQVLVFNEFGQRFSSSFPLGDYYSRPLSNIDTASNERSIFHAAVSGTLTGQVKLTAGDESGAIGLTLQSQTDGNAAAHTEPTLLHGTLPHFQADGFLVRDLGCPSDCNNNQRVTVDEIVRAVRIALGESDLAICPAADRNLDGSITIEELVVAVAAAVDACPSQPPVPTLVPRPSPTPQPPVQSVGPEILHLGLARADDTALVASGLDGNNRPIFTRRVGQGFTLVVEARRGTSASPLGLASFDMSGSAPDLQILVSRDLGDGSAAVCSGGVPGTATLDFDGAPASVAAINDLGCHLYNRPPTPCTRATSLLFANRQFDTINPESDAQFCIPVAATMAFPNGDTIVAARLRDNAGNFGPPKEIVVRVGP